MPAQFHTTYKDTDLGSPVGSSETHNIHKCPYCAENYPKGTPDTVGKLYVRKDNGVGFCFRCETAVRRHENTSSLDVKFKSAMMRLSSKCYIGMYDDAELVKTPPSQVPFRFDDINEDGMEYLESRPNPFISLMSDYLGLKQIQSKTRGVGIVAPFYHTGSIVKYQIRYSDPGKDAKYYTSPGPKYLYSPNRKITGDALKDDTEICLVEGVYDSVAQLIRGYNTPLAILGKSLTDKQLSDIQDMFPSKVYICLDDLKLSWQLARSIRSKIPSAKIIVEKSKLRGDPEEILNQECVRDENTLDKYITRVNELMESRTW